jgi:flavin-dependent dehydrogenase
MCANVMWFGLAYSDIMDQIMRFDVLVVGGGPAGLSTSIYLRRRYGLSTLVLMKDMRKHPVGEVLTPIVKEELACLGVWDKFRQSCCVESTGVSAWWGASERRDWDYIFDPHGSGWHLDRRAFESLLCDEARNLGVEIADVRRICSCSRDDVGAWRVTTDTVAGTSASHVGWVFVNATGRGSRFAHITGSKTYFDQLVALYQYFDISRCVAQWEPRLWVETTASGWWYTAPLPHDMAVAVFLTDNDLVSADRPTFFQDQLRQAPNTRERLSGSRLYSEIRICSARSGVISGYRQDGSLTVGDASYTTDPIRGHGLLQSLRQAGEASEAIARHLNGDTNVIACFNRAVRLRFRDYYMRLFEHYELERRWRSNAFWARRTR